MKYLWILITLLLISCQEKPQSQNDTVLTDTLNTWFLYGMPETLEAKNYIAKEYGFKYIQIAGCVVLQEFTDSIDLINSKLDSSIGIQFGNNWKIHFKEKVDELEREFNAVHDVLTTHKPHLKRKAELEINEYCLTYETRPIDTAKKIFDVVLFYRKYDNRKSEFVQDETYTIDLLKKTIRIKS